MIYLLWNLARGLVPSSETPLLADPTSPRQANSPYVYPRIVLRDIVSCSHTAYRPRMVSSLTVITLPSMPTVHPRGVHRVMCMLRKGGGLLRSRSPGLRSRWSSSLLLSLPMCLVEIRSLVGLSMDRDVIWVAQKSRHRTGRGDCQSPILSSRIIRNIK